MSATYGVDSSAPVVVVDRRRRRVPAASMSALPSPRASASDRRRRRVNAIDLRAARRRPTRSVSASVSYDSSEPHGDAEAGGCAGRSHHLHRHLRGGSDRSAQSRTLPATRSRPTLQLELHHRRRRRRRRAARAAPGARRRRRPRRSSRTRTRSSSASSSRRASTASSPAFASTRATGNTGTHVGNLWSASGALLARATFSAETASGWQQVNFASPVPVNAEHRLCRVVLRTERELCGRPQLLRHERRQQRPGQPAQQRRRRRQRRLPLLEHDDVPVLDLQRDELLGRPRLQHHRQTPPDTTPPTVSSVLAGGRRDRRGDDHVRSRATFSEAMDAATIERVDLRAAQCGQRARRIERQLRRRDAHRDADADRGAGRWRHLHRDRARRRRPIRASRTWPAMRSRPTSPGAFTTAAAPAAELPVQRLATRQRRRPPRRTRTPVPWSSASSSAPTSTASSPASASTRAPATPARMSATCGPPAARCSRTATFTGETASGWQQVNFATPVAGHRQHGLRRLVLRAERQLRGRRRLLRDQRRRQRPGPPAAERRQRRQRRLPLRLDERLPDLDLQRDQLLGRRRVHHHGGHRPTRRRRR